MIHLVQCMGFFPNCPNGNLDHVISNQFGQGTRCVPRASFRNWNPCYYHQSADVVFTWAMPPFTDPSKQVGEVPENPCLHSNNFALGNIKEELEYPNPFQYRHVKYH